MSDNARDQAIAQVESIVAMVAALEVDYDRLEELRDERDSYRDENLGNLASPEVHAVAWAQEFPDDAEELAELEQAAGDCESQDEARERIQEDPLSIEVRSDWGDVGSTLTASEARIVLCTGGPHVEILCDLDGGTPSNPRILYRDWGDSGELFDFDRDAVLTYLQEFYFGE